MSGAKEFWKYWTRRWPNASTDENKLKPSANYQETRAAFLAGFESAQQSFAADRDTGLPEYGATSNCEVCAKRIVFCGDNVWLHCEPQDHGFARPNGAIANPRR